MSSTIVLAPLGISSDECLQRVERVVATLPMTWEVVVPHGRPSLAAEKAGAVVTTVSLSRSPRCLVHVLTIYWRLRRSVRAPGTVTVLAEDRGWLGSYQLALRTGTRLLGVRSLTWIDADGKDRREDLRLSPSDAARSVAANARAYLRVMTLPGRLAKLRLPPTTATRPSRILYMRTDLGLAVSDEPGGSQTHAQGVIGALQDSGIDVVTATCWPVRAPGRPAPEHLQIRPPLVTDHQRELAEAAYDARVQAALRASPLARADAVYQRHALFVTAGAEIAARLGVPLILEVNGSEVRFRKQYARIAFENAGIRFEAALFAAASLVVVVSQRVADEVYEIAPTARVAVIPNGVDARIFSAAVSDRALARQKLGFEGHDVVVGFFGRFYEWHGAVTLSEAASALLPDLPELRFLFVGDGPTRDQAERVVARWPDRAIFLGLVQHVEIPSFMSACDILVSPHARIEGFIGSPTKLFEYLAAGRAIVASRLEQLSDVIDDGRTGLLVEPGDPDDLARAIRTLAADPALRARLGDAARLSAISDHSWQSRVSSVLTACQEAPNVRISPEEAMPLTSEPVLGGRGSRR